MSQHEINFNSNSALGFGKKSLTSYVAGFGLSFILTSIAFYCVAEKIFSATNLYIILTILAVAQLLVQSICFIRLNAKGEGSWNLLSFLFSLLIISILVGGSLWIMYNLNFNMVN